MYHRMPPHKQTRNNTPTPIRTGVIFIFFAAGAGAEGIGLAGTLPEYSEGGGGGVTGREAEGTAEARGEATVAAGSKVDASKTSTICSPNETTSPAFNTRGPARR